jgi:hypothetical protein
VEPDLETADRQLLTDLGGHNIFAGHKIQYGPETEPLLNVGKFQAIIKPFLRIDIMGEDQRKFFLVRPAGPSGRRLLRWFENRPDTSALTELTPYQLPPQENL